VLLVGSTGRCATLALCEALSRFTSGTLEHEPSPRLLREAWLRHVGLPYGTPLLEHQLSALRERADLHYGQTVRVAPLLGVFADALPTARFVLLFREPDAYVRSAASRGVLQRGDEWDLYRVMPLDVDLADFSRAERIALHWDALNRYQLAFARSLPDRTLPVVVGDLAADMPRIAAFAGWEIQDEAGAIQLLASRPNAGAPGSFATEDASTIRGDVRSRIMTTWTAVQALGELQLESAPAI